MANYILLSELLPGSQAISVLLFILTCDSTFSLVMPCSKSILKSKIYLDAVERVNMLCIILICLKLCNCLLGAS